MKMRAPLTLIAAALFLAAGFHGYAQTPVTTDPVGYTTLTALAATSPTTPSYSLMCLDLTCPLDYQGTIPAGGVGTNGTSTVLTFAAGTLSGLTLSGSGNSHYIEIITGSGAGAMSTIVSSDNDHTITLADNLNAVIDNVSGTCGFKTRPHWTFGTAFGASITGSAGFLQGTSPSNADLVSIMNPATGVLANYYYNKNAGAWVTGTSIATNFIIPPDCGLLITRRQTSTLSVVLQGNVKLGSTGIFITGGTGTTYSIINNPYPLSSVSLANSGLYTGTNTTGFYAATSPSSADLLSTLDPTTGVMTNYYYNKNAKAWVSGTSTANDTVIPDGTAVMITRRPGNPSFTWYVPQPTMAP